MSNIRIKKTKISSGTHTHLVNHTLGQLFKAVRQEQHLSERAFAKKVGVSHPNVRRIEADKPTSVRMIIRFAEALGLGLPEIKLVKKGRN